MNNEKLIVVSDSSILIHLSAIGCFYILQKLFRKILIPQQIYVEVVEKGWSLAGSAETSNGIEEGWILVRAVTNKKEIHKIY